MINKEKRKLKDDKISKDEQRKKRKSANNTFDKQLEQLDKMSAKAVTKQINNFNTTFANMVDKQQEMLLNFYKANTDEGKNSIKVDMIERQKSMQSQLNEMKQNYNMYNQYMSNTDKANFNEIYNTANVEMDNLSDNISKRIEGITDDADDLGKTIGDRISELGDDIMEFGNAINISSIASKMTDEIDSYVDNLRQIKTRTGETFDTEAYSKTITDLTHQIKGFSRTEASEFVSTFIQESDMRKMSEVDDYVEELANITQSLGTKWDSYADIMWKDQAMGENGKMIRALGNMTGMLEDNDNLYISADKLLESINENTSSLFGLARGDSKRYKAMAGSLATLETVSSSAANSGVDTAVKLFKEWSTQTTMELYDDDKFVNFSQLIGENPADIKNMLSTSEGTATLLDKFQKSLDGMSENELYSWRDNLGFESVADMLNFQMADGIGDTAMEAANTIDKASNVDYSYMGEKEEETTGWVEATKNDITAWAPLAKACDVLGALDIKWANLANIVVATSGIFKAGGKLLNWLKEAKGAGGILNTLKSGLGDKLGGLSGLSETKIGSFISNGFSKLGSTKLGTTFSSLFGKASSTATGAKGALSGLSGATTSTGASVLGTAMLGVTGAIMSIKDAIGGFKKSSDWLGEEKGKSVSGKVSSTVGGLLGGTGNGIADKGSIGSKAKNVLGNTAKYAAVGGAIGSVVPVVGTALGAGIGAITGAITGAIGGKNITKAIQGTWDFVKSSASKAFSGIGEGVVVVANAMKKMGPLGEAIGNTVTDSIDIFKETGNSIKDIWSDKDRGIFSKIGGTISALFSASGKLGITLIKNFSGFAKSTWDSVKESGQGVLENLKNGASLLAEAGSTLLDGAKSLWEKAKEKAKGVTNWVGEKASNAWNNVTNLFGYEDGLSYVPNNGLAMLHQGEAVLTKNQADTVRASADGGLNVSNQVTNTNNGLVTEVGDMLLKVVNGLAKNTINSLSTNGMTNGVNNAIAIANITNDIIPNSIKTIFNKLTNKKENAISNDAYNVLSDDFKQSMQRLKTPTIINSEPSNVFADNTSNNLSNDNLSLEKNTLQSIDNYDSNSFAYLSSLDSSTKNINDILNQTLTEDKKKNRETKSSNNKLVNTLSKNGILGLFGGNSSGASSSSKKSSLFMKLFSALSGGVTAFANGGIVNSATLGLLGESGTEAVIPLKDSSQNSSVTSVSGSGMKGIWDFLAGKGLSPAGIAGVIGNIGVESGGTFDPHILQNDLPMTDKSYNYDLANGIHDGKGYGLVQWTYYTRKQGLLDKAKATGLPYSDMSLQLSYMWDEMQGYSGLINNLKSATDVNSATEYFMNTFEKPGTPNLSQRKDYANTAYNQYASYDVGTPFVPNDQVALIHEGEMIVPADSNPLNDSNTSTINTTNLTTNNNTSKSDNSADTIETLKWAVYRLENKLDKIISNTTSGTTKKKINANDTDIAYTL